MKTVKRILATFLVVLMFVTSAPLSGFVGMNLPELPKINFLASAADSNKAIDYSDLTTNQYMAKVILNYDYYGLANLYGELESTPYQNNFNKSLNKTIPYGSEILYDLGINDSGFMATLSAWKTATFEPSDVLDQLLDEKGYYLAIIYSILDVMLKDNDFISNINNQFGKMSLDLVSAATKIAKNTAEINLDDLNGVLSEADKSTYINFLVDKVSLEVDEGFYTYFGKGVSFVKDALKVAKTVQNIDKTLVSYMMMANLGETIKSVLYELYQNTSIYENAVLKEALWEAYNVCSSDMQAAILGVVETGTEILNFAFSKIVGDVWTSCLKGVAGGFVSGALIGQAIGKSIANFCFSVDPAVEQFFAMQALLEFQDVMVKCVKSLSNKFKANQSEENADIFFESVKMLFSTYTLNNEYALDFVDIVKNKGIGNKIWTWAKKDTTFDEWKESVQSLNGTINTSKLVLTDIEFYNPYFEADAPLLYQKYFNRINNYTNPVYKDTEPIYYDYQIDTDNDNSYLLEYKIEKNNMVTVISCNSATYGTVIIPNEIEGYPVTNIGHYAFRGCSKISNIVIPDSVTEIGHRSFQKCTSLKSVSFGQKVQSIGAYAFEGCTGLTEISLPESTRVINNNAFQNCGNLIKLELNNGLKELGYEIIAGTGVTSIVIPKTVSIINSNTNSGSSNAYSAFTGANELKTVVFEYGMLKIPDYALLGCTSVMNVILPNGLAEIGNYAFTNCSNLTSVTIPDSVTKIGYNAFLGCMNIEIQTAKNTAAYKYAVDNNIKVVEIDCTHSLTKTIDETVVSCTADGIRKVVCKICEATISTEIIPATGHNNSIEYVLSNATCKNTGLKQVICSKCGQSEQVVIPTIGHTLVSFGEVRSATCTQSGISQGKKCSVCNIVIEAQTETPALGHTSDAGTVTKKATCTVAGTKTYKCTVCGEVLKTETVKKTAHKLVVIPAVESTCAKTGLTEGKKCSVCNTITVKQETVAKKSHTYKNVVTKATLSANGKVVPTCSVCKATKAATTVYYPKTFKLSATSYSYDGKAKKPTVTVTDSNGKVIANTNYTLSYSANTEIGTSATVKVTFKGNYSGSKSIKFKIVPAQVTGLKASSVATTSIKLAWTKVNGAKYYKVEQSADGKTWKVLTTTDKTTYTVSNLTAGSKMQFRVTALDSTKKITGKVSAVLKTGTKTSAPTVTLKSSKSKTVTATWKKITGASKYIVYKSTDNKKWTKVGETTKLTYDLTKLTGGKKIYVKVVAVNAYNVNSADSKVVNVTVKK